MPEGDLKKIKKDYIKSGKWGTISAAHASNALVVTMKPEEGIYSLCTGPAIRGAAPISPDLAISIYNERNAFWDLVLRDSPEQMVEKARILASDLIYTAKNVYKNNEVRNKPKEVYLELLDEIDKMEYLEKSNSNDLNKLIRVYTRIHVISRQFINFHIEPDKFVYKQG